MPSSKKRQDLEYYVDTEGNFLTLNPNLALEVKDLIESRGMLPLFEADRNPLTKTITYKVSDVISVLPEIRKKGYHRVY